MTDKEKCNKPHFLMFPFLFISEQCILKDQSGHVKENAIRIYGVLEIFPITGKKWDYTMETHYNEPCVYGSPCVYGTYFLCS